ncbi:MAG: 5'-methylthioadenosine/S-adenosylhomocysteine nucleosidase [Anaerolineae bacterium]|nr:5'-methylthioadenosine/S-adenosylhomocysteine nucleosidase [Anaerolineae bacterium]
MKIAQVVVLICAEAEWRVARQWFQQSPIEQTPFGESLHLNLCGSEVACLHTGWGKVAAAAATQYAIQSMQPSLVINLGTCGGFAGEIERGAVILAEETLIYDIIEQMGDPDQALDYYRTHLDLAWLSAPPYPLPVRRGRLISADRDILSHDIPTLKQRFQAVAADWESGAIAWVAHRNGTPCLILRGVSDLVAESGGEAYGDLAVFHAGTQQVMQALLESLPNWLACANIGFLECGA